MRDNFMMPTIGSIAERFGVRVHNVRYVIETRNIEPSGRAGSARVFSEADVERIGLELKQIAFGRSIQTNAAPSLQNREFGRTDKQLDDAGIK